MKNQFDLVLANPLKMLAVGAGCFVLLMTFLFSLASNGVTDWVFGAVMLPVSYGLYRLVKEFGSDEVQITIAPDKLLVVNKQSGQETSILFANISSYRYQEYNGNP